MFKMGCSMARKILTIDARSSPDSMGSRKSKDKHHSSYSADAKAKTTSGDELNDFSKLQNDPRIPLNVRQIFKITKSWKAIARTMSKTGTAMFLNLFEQNQDLFYLFDRFQHLKGAELNESMELREHAATVMSTLDQSINSLSDYDNFVKYLHSIGQLHRKIPGFRRSHFWKIEQPFMKAVKQTLDERCNEAIEEIYKIAIKLIIETIADGYGEDDVSDTQKQPGAKPDASARPQAGSAARDEPQSNGSQKTPGNSASSSRNHDNSTSKGSTGQTGPTSGQQTAVLASSKLAGTIAALRELLSLLMANNKEDKVEHERETRKRNMIAHTTVVTQQTKEGTQQFGSDYNQLNSIVCYQLQHSGGALSTNLDLRERTKHNGVCDHPKTNNLPCSNSGLQFMTRDDNTNSIYLSTDETTDDQLAYYETQQNGTAASGVLFACDSLNNNNIIGQQEKKDIDIRVKGFTLKSSRLLSKKSTTQEGDNSKTCSHLATLQAQSINKDHWNESSKCPLDVLQESQFITCTTKLPLYDQCQQTSKCSKLSIRLLAGMKSAKFSKNERDRRYSRIRSNTPRKSKSSINQEAHKFVPTDDPRDLGELIKMLMHTLKSHRMKPSTITV